MKKELAKLAIIIVLVFITGLLVSCNGGHGDVAFFHCLRC